MCGGALAFYVACKSLGFTPIEERNGQLRAMRGVELNFEKGGGGFFYTWASWRRREPQISSIDGAKACNELGEEGGGYG